MNKRIGMALGLLLLPLVAMAGKADLASDSVMTMRVDGDVSVGTDGHVTQYQITTPVSPEIEKALGTVVRGWAFKPVEFNDQPAKARSLMRVTLAAQRSHGGYAVSIDNVTFRDYPKGSPLAPGEVRADAAKSGQDQVMITTDPGKPMRPPEYPRGLMRGGVEGSVLLYIKVTPGGQAEQVVAAQSSLFNVRGRSNVLEEARKILEHSAVVAAKRWHFQVKAQGKVPTDADLTVTVPVVYSIGRKTSPDKLGEWRVESRSAKTVVPWLVDQDKAQDIRISDLNSGDVMPVASAFEVPKGAIGQAL